ncbi:MAG: hypothetical protein U5K38_16985 [Woeseiaceae bacterium]|nr:hypothetical protein [Woeseiaceae bacterium]
MPDLFLITGRGGNSVVRRTDDGLVLVDNKVMYNLVWDELNQIIDRRVGDQPVKLAFITIIMQIMEEITRGSLMMGRSWLATKT